MIKKIATFPPCAASSTDFNSVFPFVGTSVVDARKNGVVPSGPFSMAAGYVVAQYLGTPKISGTPKFVKMASENSQSGTPINGNPHTSIYDLISF